MRPERPVSVLPLLKDDAWFGRIMWALVAGDDEPGVDAPVRPLQPRPGPSLKEAVALTELRGQILQAVLALREPWRATVVLRFLEGWPLLKVARVTRSPEGIAHRRVRRGLQWLRAALRSNPGRCENLR